MKHEVKKRYEWLMSSFAKGIPADKAVAEIERIEIAYGKLTPETILDASTPPNSVFHKLYDWNDSSAAHKYRLQMSRTIYNNIVIIVIDQAGRKLTRPVYENIKIEVKDETTGKKKKQSQYKNITYFITSEFDQHKEKIIKRLESIKEDLQMYKEFGNVVLKINETIVAVKKIQPTKKKGKAA